MGDIVKFCSALIAIMSIFSSIWAEAPKVPEELFQMDTIWTVHLKLNAEQFSGLEPKQDDLRGGPPGGGRGPDDFPVNALQTAFLEGRESLSRADFQALAQRWFEEWDVEKQGYLDADVLGKGVAKLLPEISHPGIGGMRPPMISVDFPEVRGDVTVGGETISNIGIRYKGNASYRASKGQLKRSLKLDLNQFTKGQKIAGVSTLNLHSNVTDPGWMNEPIAYWLYREAGVPSPRTAYARVSLTVPGQYDTQYVGLYSLVEQVNKTFIEEHLGSRDGVLFKPEGAELFVDLGEDWAAYEATGYESKNKLAATDQQRVMEFSRFVATVDDEEFARRLGEFLEIDEFARYMAVTVWLSSTDSLLAMNHNYYLYLDGKTRKFQIWPWDLDLSFGKFGGAGEALSITQPWQGKKLFLSRVFAVGDFQRLYRHYLEEFNATIFQPERIAEKIQELGDLLYSAVADESAEKLIKFKKMVAGEEIPQPFERKDTGGGPPNFEAGKPIMPFVEARIASVKAQLDGEDVHGNTQEGAPGGRRRSGHFLGNAFLRGFDGDADDKLTRQEFLSGFDHWFTRWNVDQSGTLTQEQLHEGLKLDFARPQRPPMPPDTSSLDPSR